MQAFFAAVLLVHAAVHMLVFLSAWRFGGQLFPASLRRAGATDHHSAETLLLASCWLGVGAAVAVAGVTALSAIVWWPAYTVMALCCSLFLATIEWDDVPAAPLCAMLDATLVAFLWAAHLLDVML